MLRAADLAPWGVLALAATAAGVWDTPLATTLGVAALSAILAAAGGVAWATCVAASGREATLWRGLAWAGLLVPPYLSAVGLIEFCGPAGRIARAVGAASRPDLPTTQGWVYTWWSYALTLAGAWLPLVGLAVDAAWRRLPPRALAAARLAHGRRGLWELRLSVARAPALAGALAVGVLGLGEFAAAQLQRVPVVSEAVHTAAHAPWAALKVAAPLLGAATLALLGGAWATRRPLPGAGVQPSAPPRSWRARAAAGVGALALVLYGVWLPLGFLVARLGSRPGSGSSFDAARAALAEAWTFAQRDVAWTLGVGACTATWVTALAVGVALGARRRPRLQLAALLPAVLCAATPAPLIGVAVLWVGSLGEPLTWLRDSAAAVSLTWALRFAAWPLLGLILAVRRLPRSPLEAAALTPRTPLVRWARTHAHVLLPALALAWGLTFALAVGEFEATLLVSPPGQPYLAVTVVNEAHYGQGHILVGFVALQLAVLAAPALLAGIGWLAWRGVRAAISENGTPSPRVSDLRH